MTPAPWLRRFSGHGAPRDARGRWLLADRSGLASRIEDEYRRTCLEFQRARFPDRSPLPFLDWIHQKALHCLPAPLRKQRSRDASDDPFLACALAARAEYVVASDRDLLSLGKPFGIAVVTPAEFIRRAAEQSRFH